VNHWRVGYGSDTEGPEQFSVTQNTTTTKSRAKENLMARIPQFQAIAKSAITSALWNKLNYNQQAALTSLVYNYGHVPASVRVYILDPKRTAAAIEARGVDNGGINRKRRKAEANFYLKPIETPPYIPPATIGGLAALLAALAQYMGAYPGMPVLLVLAAVGCLSYAFYHWRLRPVPAAESPIKTASQTLKSLLVERDVLDAAIVQSIKEVETERDETNDLLNKAARKG